MIKIIHKTEFIDKQEVTNVFELYHSNGWNQSLGVLTISRSEAHELHTALGEKLKEITHPTQ